MKHSDGPHRCSDQLFSVKLASKPSKIADDVGANGLDDVASDVDPVIGPVDWGDTDEEYR